MKEKLVMITDCLILIFLTLITVLFIINEHHWLQQLIIGISWISWLLYLLLKYVKRKPKSTISKVQLLNENEKVTHEWYIRDEQGLIIGKNFQNQLVDIDLTDADYAVLIDRQHAILNSVDGKWFLEDLGSRNKTGLKAVGATQVRRLKDEEIVEVKAGDRIYIAKAILQLVK